MACALVQIKGNGNNDDDESKLADTLSVFVCVKGQLMHPSDKYTGLRCLLSILFLFHLFGVFCCCCR